MTTTTPSSAGGSRPSPDARATRVLRSALVFLVVLGLERRFADPAEVATGPARLGTPWAMLALLPVFGLGLWTYEMTSDGGPDFKSDLLWGVFLATACYVAIFVTTTYL